MMKNRTLKSITVLLLVLASVFGFSAAAFADNASITFKTDENGIGAVVFAPGSVFTDTDLFDGFKGVMPGDVRTQNITVSNKADDCDYVRLWLRAVPHTHADGENPISPAVLSRLTADRRRGDNPELDYMLDFLSRLSLEVYNGEAAIYRSSPDKTAGLTEPVCLGTLEKGQTLSLKAVLSVPEALGNAYGERLGEIDWLFTAECFNEGLLTVRKIWEDGNSPDRPEQVTVELLRDGKPVDEAVLNDGNQWMYSWNELGKKHEWMVREKDVPDGYETASSLDGNVVTIVNIKPVSPPPPPPTRPVDIGVVKVWDDKDPKNRPEKVRVTLYDGKRAVETVELNEENGWRHDWKQLDGNGSWQVVETSVPKNYTPSYSVSGGIVTIKNTAVLIHTGQNVIPVLVLGGVGLMLVAYGVIFILRKRRNEEAG